jgi:hypothetical protein
MWILSFLLIKGGDIGHRLRLAMTAWNYGGGPSLPAYSNLTEVITVAPGENVSPPTLSGNAVVGQTLTADVGQWIGTAPIVYTIEWQRCFATFDFCVSTNVTGPSYTITAQDAGIRVKAVVRAMNSWGTTYAGVMSPVITA